MKEKILLALLVVLALVLSGCEKLLSSLDGGKTYTFEVTMYQPINEYGQRLASGKMVYGKLVARGGDVSSPALYSGSAQFPWDSGTAKLTFTKITNGTYMMILFIDMNGNASSTYLIPDSGDYVYKFGPFYVFTNFSYVVTEYNWKLQQ